MGKENELLEAARVGNVNIIDRLLSVKQKNVLTQALSFRRSVSANCQDGSGYTPLHHAVLNGHCLAVQQLLKYDASPIVPDNNGNTPLHLAAWTGNGTILVTLLISGISRAQVNEQVQNNDLDSHLHFAAQYGHTGVVDILLENGANPDVLNKKGETPLELASQYGHLEVVNVLLKNQPRLLERIPPYRSLLHLAARNGHHLVIKKLLDYGCDINKKLNSGTALHEAAMFGKVEVVRVLLESRPQIDVYAKDGQSETALEKIQGHSPKIAQDIALLIKAFARGEPLPEPSSPVVSLCHSSDGDDAEPPSVYDNLPSKGTRTLPLMNRKTREIANGGGSGRARPYQKRPTLNSAKSSPSVDADGNYVNIRFGGGEKSRTPPKKPARVSIGNLLEQLNENGLTERPDTQGVPIYDPSVYDLEQPQTEVSPGASSGDSIHLEQDCGDYAMLRLDAQLVRPSQRSDTEDGVHSRSNSSTDSQSTGINSLPDETMLLPETRRMNSAPIASIDSDPEGDIEVYELLAEAVTGNEKKTSAVVKPVPAPRSNVSPRVTTARTQPETPSHPPPSPHTAMLGVQARILQHQPPGVGASEKDHFYHEPPATGRTSTHPTPSDGRINTHAASPVAHHHAPLPSQHFVFQDIPEPSRRDHLYSKPTPVNSSPTASGPTNKKRGTRNVNSMQLPDVHYEDLASVPSQGASSVAHGHVKGVPRKDSSTRTTHGDMPGVPYGNIKEGPYGNLSRTPHGDKPGVTYSEIKRTPSSAPYGEGSSAPHRDVEAGPYREVTSTTYGDVKTVPASPPHGHKSSVSYGDVKAVPASPAHGEVTSVTRGDIKVVPLSPHYVGVTSVTYNNVKAAPSSPGVPSSPHYGEVTSVTYSDVKAVPASPHYGEVTRVSYGNISDTATSHSSNPRDVAEPRPVTSPSAGGKPVPHKRKLKPQKRDDHQEGLKEECQEVLRDDADSSSCDSDILRPDDTDPFAGLVKGSNCGQLQGGREMGTDTKGNNGHQTEESNGLDESSEWAQIESIMASFGAGLVRESVYVRDYENNFQMMLEGKEKPRTVAEWLDKLGVGQYLYTLIANGFDNLKFLDCSIMTDQDLREIGIQDDSHRKLLLEAAKCLPKMKSIGDGDGQVPIPSSITEWLRSLVLSDYIHNFLENHKATMEKVRGLWDVELENVLEIHMLGHRKRILASLGDWRLPSGGRTYSLNSSNPRLTSKSAADLTLDLQPTQHSPTIVRSNSSSLDIDLFKDYSKDITSPSRRRPAKEVKAWTLPDRHTRHQNSKSMYSLGYTHSDESLPEELHAKSDELAVPSKKKTTTHEIGTQVTPGIDNDIPDIIKTDDKSGLKSANAAPSGGEDSGDSSSLDVIANTQQQWMHRPDDLVNGCCNYTASYLGSTIVKELQGTESTRLSCVKLRRSASHVQKVPTITLSISYAGVKFIDTKSKRVITEHEICNISCVSQYEEDMKTFAYVTRDEKYDRIYCHVFTVKTLELATEIILTLGQAFELAYQLLMKTNPSSSNTPPPPSKTPPPPTRTPPLMSTETEDTKL